MCTGYCLADRIDLKRLEASWLQRLQRRAPSAPDEQHYCVIPLNQDVVVMKVGPRLKDCFVFCSGSLVCWGCSPAETQMARDTLRPVLIGALAQEFIETDHVLMGEVSLSGPEPPTFERLSLAYALAQSVCLGSLEKRIECSIASTRSIPETMAMFGHVTVSSKHVQMKVGEMFVLRNRMNLNSDILDTPEFFWDYEVYEQMYVKFREHLDVDQRVNVVNQRIEVMTDLFDVLENDLHHQDEGRIQWIIIILCALEAMVMAVRLFARFHHKGYKGWESESTLFSFFGASS